MNDAPDGSYLDVHSHLLPGADDGCGLTADSLECIRLLQAAGFRASYCTPHFIPAIYPDLIPKLVAERVALLQTEVRAAGLDYELRVGAEVRLHSETIPWFHRFGVPTLGDSRCVLVDYFGREWPDFADKTIHWLIERGYRPILAHPERMGLAPDEFEPLLTRLRADGVWLQGNLGSLGGGEGAAAADRAVRWLQAGDYRLLASDLHRPAHWPERAAGLAAASERIGDVRTLIGCQQVDASLYLG